MKKTVLIIGISSFVGSNLALVLKNDYRVVGTYYKMPVEIPGVTCYPCDVFKKDYLLNLIGLLKPDFTIYAVGISSLTECNLHPKQADALNAVGAVNACTASERYGSKFIYFSSCYVMGGENQLYKESDTPFPNTVYGSTLSSTEFYIQRSCLNYLVLRCSPLYGRSYGPRHPNWFEFIQSSLVQNVSLLADDKVTTGFLDIAIMGKLLKSFMDSGVSNRLFQVSSRDHLTRYEFARLVAKVFKKDDNLIQRSSIPFPVEAGRAADSGMGSSSQQFFKMDSFNIEEFLKIKMPTIEESLQLTQKRLMGHALPG
jgi:dTDP-4-dehydrorhamnose reductase